MGNDEMPNARFSILFIFLFSLLTLEAAPTIRLVYGKSWSEAGRRVKKTLESAAFKSAAKGRYLVECVDESGDKPSPKNLGSIKLPAIFVISEQGNCFFVKENMPSGVEAAQILAAVERVDKVRLAAEKAGFDTADKCGAFLERMEKFTGGPQRVISKGYYADVFDKLVRLDPGDSTGWQRHFTMGDGIDIVIKANEYREKGDFSGGEAFLAEEFKKPRRHLTKEQTQALLMAKFALYRENESKRDELVGFLRRVAEVGEDTLWGTSAVGWLNIMKEPPLSTYWGWRKGDFKGPKFSVPVKFGASSSFPRQGRYTISFTKTSGVNFKIETIAIMAGKEEAAVLKNPVCEGDTTSFDFDMKRAWRGKITAIVVNGVSDPDGNSSGKINIKRHILKARKS